MIVRADAQRGLSFSDDDLNGIYDKTGRYCYYRGKKIDWSNYGHPGEKGSWEVDHKVPISRGGSDSFANLVPACPDCNRTKADLKPSGL